MRKFVISLAAAASTVAFATPAAAQYFPQPDLRYDQGYDYGYDQGYDDDYRYGHGHGGRWAAEVERIRADIRQLASRGDLTGREVRQLSYNVSVVQNAIHKFQRNGIDRFEARDLDRRVRNLHISLQRSASDADRRFGRSAQYNDRYDYERWDD